MTFNDIFKSAFLSNVTAFEPLDMVIGLSLAFALGLMIFFIYKKTYSGVMYSSGFGISLVAMAMITCLVILTISSNVVLSLGMVGALSIVRFRTAVKDPMDIVYLFWAIAVGIVLGAGMIPLAVFGSALIGAVLLLFANRKGSDKPYLLILDCVDDTGEDTALSEVESAVKRHVVKSKTVSGKGVELTLEIRLPGGGTEFVNRVARLPGVTNAVLVSYNGEYMT